MWLSRHGRAECPAFVFDLTWRRLHRSCIVLLSPPVWAVLPPGRFELLEERSRAQMRAGQPWCWLDGGSLLQVELDDEAERRRKRIEAWQRQKAATAAEEAAAAAASAAAADAAPAMAWTLEDEGDEVAVDAPARSGGNPGLSGAAAAAEPDVDPLDAFMATNDAAAAVQNQAIEAAAVAAAEDDDVDPLDAFMATSVLPEVQRAVTAAVAAGAVAEAAAVKAEPGAVKAEPGAAGASGVGAAPAAVAEGTGENGVAPAPAPAAAGAGGQRAQKQARRRRYAYSSESSDDEDEAESEEENDAVRARAARRPGVAGGWNV